MYAGDALIGDSAIFIVVATHRLYLDRVNDIHSESERHPSIDVSVLNF